MSNSAMSDLKRSPWHYINRVNRAPTTAMKAGTLAHCAVLEPGAVSSRYAIKPAGLDGRTKEGKAWAESCAGLEVITADEHATALAQRNAVHGVPELAALLATGYAETSVFWTDPATGVYCKARPDWVHPLADGRVILLDLKTTADESPAGFGKSVANFGYHRQAAHYSDGFAIATGREVAAFVFAAVSAAPPFLAVPYMLDDSAKAAGKQQRDELLARYAACLEADDWPAYGSGVQVLSLPAWAA
jgi:exodeoxyribonuclease VIII